MRLALTCILICFLAKPALAGSPCEDELRELSDAAISALATLPDSALAMLKPDASYAEASKGFVAELCEHYRDDVLELRLRLERFSNFHTLTSGNSAAPSALGENPWKKLSAEDFQELVILVDSLERSRIRQFRELVRKGKAYGQFPDPYFFSVAEMRFLIQDFVLRRRKPSGWKDYEKGSSTFLRECLAQGTCSEQQLTDVYLFRGEYALNPFSLESPLLAQLLRMFSRRCAQDSTSAACSSYKEFPYRTRRDEAVRFVKGLLLYSADSEVFLRELRTPKLFVAADPCYKPVPLKGTPGRITLGKGLRAYARMFGIPIENSKRRTLRERVLEAAKHAIGKIEQSRFCASDEKSSNTKNLELSGFSAEVATRRLKTAVSLNIHYNSLFAYHPELSYLLYPLSTSSSTSRLLSVAFKFSYQGWATSFLGEPSPGWLFVIRVPKERLKYLATLDPASVDFAGDWFVMETFSKDFIAQDEVETAKWLSIDLSQVEQTLYLKQVPQTTELLEVLTKR